MSSPPDQGEPQFKFNHTVTDFVPQGTSITPDFPQNPMETVPEMPSKNLQNFTDAPEFVPGQFPNIIEMEAQTPSPVALNHQAEEFKFFGNLVSELNSSLDPHLEKLPEEPKVPVPDIIDDASTSDDEDLAAENRPLTYADVSDPDSDFEDQPVSSLSIPHSPLRETSMLQRIYNPEFILTVKSDPESSLIPENLSIISTRKIDEIRFEGRPIDRRRVPRPVVEPIGFVRGKDQLPPDDPAWRHGPTEEEKKIAQKAKETTAKIQSDKSEDEATKRNIKITLNKLSPTNLDKLKEQLLEISKQSDDNLRLLSVGIFDKAWSQVKFTQLYASLCQYLDDFYASVGIEADATAKPKAKSKKNVRNRQKFREAILTMCQQVFEAKDDLDVTGLDSEQAEKKKNLHRDRTLGNVRFIGELYKVSILGQTTLLHCAWDLIDRRLAHPQSLRVEELELDEDRLEGVNILLTTVKDKLNVSTRVQETTNNIYEQLRSIVANRTDLSTKIKYRLLVSLI